MLETVIFLYALGWLALVAGFIIAIRVTPRAVRSIESDLSSIDAWYWTQFSALNERGEAESAREALEAERQRRLEKALIPIPSMMGSGNVTQAAQFTILRIARANIPTAVVALIAALLSTIASVLSLYL